MLDGSRELLRVRSMEEDRCCCKEDLGVGGGLHPDLIRLLLQRETRLLRMAQFLVAVLLLVICGALALLFTVGLGGGCRLQRDSQDKRPPDSISLATGKETGTSRHEDKKPSEHPSAMLTVSSDDITVGKYLRWESGVGNAFCRGGFTYANGSLVVPRDGIYSVFLQITYRGTICLEPQMTFTGEVFVFRDSYRKDEPVLFVSDTVNCSSEFTSKTLHTSCLLSLEAKTQLRVTATHPSYISKNEQRAFFGAVLVEALTP